METLATKQYRIVFDEHLFIGSQKTTLNEGYGVEMRRNTVTFWQIAAAAVI